MRTSAQTIDTRERLLDASERLFAQHGIDATSLRHITAEASANLASVNYHFGSKEALLREVFARRIGPVNQERLQLLDACEGTAGAGPSSLECILEAFVAPALRLRLDPAHGGEPFMCLMGRLHTEPHELKMVIFEQFREVFQRFTAALHRCLPDLPEEDMLWRLFFTVGSMAHTMSAGQILEHFAGGRCDPTDVEGTIHRLTAFAAAGFRASVSESSGESV